jgi:AraC family transcriptional regulator
MKLSPIPLTGRTLLIREARGLRASLGSYPRGTQPLHVHEHASFSVLVAGRGVDRSRSQAYDQPPLTAVFHPTSAPHTNDIGPGGVLGLTLEMEPAWLEAHGLTGRALGGYRVIAPTVRSRLACLSLLAAAWRGGPCVAADVETHALEMLELLLAPAPGPERRPVPGWLSRGEEFLRAHFRSPISLSQAAREAGVHPIHFARVFRRRHGCPVSAYLRALRLTAAGELIVSGSQPLAQVACGTGFADQAHLTRWFSRVIGLSPGALRRLRHLPLPAPVSGAIGSAPDPRNGRSRRNNPGGVSFVQEVGRSRP